MIRYAIHPDFAHLADKIRPVYSHGDSYNSMCIDMFAAEDVTFSKATQLVYVYYNKETRELVRLGTHQYTRVSDAWSKNPALQFIGTEEGWHDVDGKHNFPSLLPYVNVNTGIAFELEPGLHVEWGGRSGNAFNKGRLLFEGKIDSPYRDTVAALIYSLNPLDEFVTIKAGEKIGQIKIVDYRPDHQRFPNMGKHERLGDIYIPHLNYNVDPYELVEVPWDELETETVRGTNGFGSTGDTRSTINEMRANENLPPVVWGDTPIRMDTNNHWTPVEGSINDLRAQEGLPPVPWGELPPVEYDDSEVKMTREEYENLTELAPATTTTGPRNLIVMNSKMNVAPKMTREPTPSLKNEVTHTLLQGIPILNELRQPE